VRAEHRDRAVGNLLELFHKHGALRAERLNHMAVVNDFMTDVHWRAVNLDCPFDNLDGTLYTGAEATRLRQKDTNGSTLISFGHATALQSISVLLYVSRNIVWFQENEKGGLNL
jgi:hypothetical protein